MKLRVFFILVLPALLLLTFWSWASLYPSNHLNVSQVQQVARLIQKNYAQPVDSKKLTLGAIDGMLRSLDPYSVYLDKEAIQDLENTALGRFGGLGLEVTVKNGFLSVITPLAGSPAEAAGVRSEDTILKIGEWSTKDTTLREAIKHMKGQPGTIVNLHIMREGDRNLIDIPIQRELIVVKSIKEARLLEPSVGYVKLAAFQEHTAEDFKEALTQLKTEGATSLVLDLRNNPGGLLSAAIESAEQIIPKEKLIVSTQGLNSPTVKYFSSNENPFQFKPIIVLVNRGSASGSEIIAALIQDYKMGVVVGSRTFGKGSVQKILPLGKDGAIRITSSYYHTPSGHIVQQGLRPDIEVADRSDAGAKDDPPLNRALELAKQP